MEDNSSSKHKEEVTSLLGLSRMQIVEQSAEARYLRKKGWNRYHREDVTTKRKK